MKRFRRMIGCIGVFILIFTLFATPLSVSAVERLHINDYNAFKKLLSSTDSYDSNKLNHIEVIDNRGKTVYFSLFTLDKEQIYDKKGKPVSTYHTIAFDSTHFDNLSDNAKSMILTNFKDAMQKDTNISSEGKHLIYSEMRNGYTDGLDTETINQFIDDIEPDIFTAHDIFSPFSSTVGTIFGVLCIFIVFSLVLSTLMDLVYIAFPVMRERIHGSQENKRPWFVSQEAFSTVLYIESEEKYHNAYGIYFKRRIISYIVLTLCLTYLLSGQIITLIIWCVQNIGNAFGGWFS